MGLISSVAKYAERAMNIVPEFLLGDSAEIAGRAMNKTEGSIFDKVKAGVRALDNNAKKEGGFIKRVFNNLVTTPKTVAFSTKAGARAARMAGKSSFMGGLRGVFKGIAKKMPFIGAAITVLWEAPNIYTAFKEGGLTAGLKEVGGATVELGTMAAGAAIGSAICPGVGTIIGGILGGIAGAMLRGETYTDKKEAAEAEAQLPKYSEDDVNELKGYGFTDEQIEAMRQSGTTMEDIRNALAEEGVDIESARTSQETSSNDTKVKNPTVAEAQSADKQLDELKAEIELLKSQLQQVAQNGYGSFNPYSSQMSFGGGYNLYTNPFASAGLGSNSSNQFENLWGSGNIYNGTNSNYRFRYMG